MPFIRLDEGMMYPNLEQEVERVELGCLGADCGSGTTFGPRGVRIPCGLPLSCLVRFVSREPTHPGERRNPDRKGQHSCTEVNFL